MENSTILTLKNWIFFEKKIVHFLIVETDPKLR
jgi:hypothetical protein